MAGLDNLPIDQARDPSEEDVKVQTTGVKVPGVGKIAGNVAVNMASPEMLANMQNMIDQRTGGFKTFLDSMKDAVAITSRDPGSAMAARDQEKRLEQQSIFEMRNTMAALKAAKDQQEQFQARRAASFGGAPAPAAGGAAAQPGYTTINGVSVPNAYAAALASARSEDEYNAIWNNKVLPYINKQEEIKASAAVNPENIKQQPFFLNGKTIQMSINQYNSLPQEVKDKIAMETYRQLGYVPGGQNATTAPTPMGNAPATAQSLGVPIISGNRDLAKQTELWNASQQPGYKGPPVARPGTSQHEFGNAVDLPSNATEADKQKLRDAGFVNPYPNDPNHWELKNAAPVKPVNTPAASSPVQTAGNVHPTWNAPFTPVSVPKPAFNNAAEEQAWQKSQADLQDLDAKDKAKFLASGKMFEPTLNTLAELRNQAKGHEEVFDLTGKHPWKAGAYDLLHMTNKTPAEEQIARQNLTPDSRTVFKNVQAGAAKIQSDKAITDAQAGGGRLSRMGQELAGKTKGVGTDSTYGSFMTNLALLEEEARTKQNQIAFANAHKDIPMNQIEAHPYYINGAREDARRETAKNFADIPNANYSGKDKNGRLWVVKDGKKVYAE